MEPKWYQRALKELEEEYLNGEITLPGYDELLKELEDELDYWYNERR